MIIIYKEKIKSKYRFDNVIYMGKHYYCFYEGQHKMMMHPLILATRYGFDTAEEYIIHIERKQPLILGENIIKE